MQYKTDDLFIKKTVNYVTIAKAQIISRLTTLGFFSILSLGYKILYFILDTTDAKSVDLTSLRISLNLSSKTNVEDKK